MPLIEKIMNSDGTEYDPPVHPEYHKITDKYPKCRSWGYKCMYCGDCPYGDNFKPANDEEKRIIEEQSKMTWDYTLKHNPDIAELLSRHEK